MLRVYGGFGGRLINASHGEVLDVASGRSWIGDKLAGILEHLLELTVVMPSWLKASGFVRDRKQAYVYVQRLVRLGVLERTGRYGVYRVRHDVIVRLLQLPVRRVSEGIARARRKLKMLLDGGGVRRARVGGFVFSLCGGGGLWYGGLFVDNVGCVRGGVYSPWPGGRGGLLRVSDLGLFCDGVSYFEVSHVVGGVSVGGQVVVYSNSGDAVRFGDCVRVEWRPGEGFVSSNGVVGTLRGSRVEFVRAWVALGVVLRFGLGLARSHLSSLYRWLGRVWGLAGPGGLR
jgi:hypothetical protein